MPPDAGAARELHEDAGVVISSPALSLMLGEARQMRGDKDVVKSNSSAAILLLVTRLIEALTLGAPVTPLPVKNAHPEDDEPPLPASQPRRL